MDLYSSKHDWANYLAPYLKKLSGISKLHHFRFNRHDPGKVFYREYTDSPKREFQLLKDINRLPPCVLPPQVLPGGLDEERKEISSQGNTRVLSTWNRRFSGPSSNMVLTYPPFEEGALLQLLVTKLVDFVNNTSTPCSLS